jgi:hypothetical protein
MIEKIIILIGWSLMLVGGVVMYNEFPNISMRMIVGLFAGIVGFAIFAIVIVNPPRIYKKSRYPMTPPQQAQQELNDDNKPGCFGAFGKGRFSHLRDCANGFCRWESRCKQSREDY